MRSAVPRSDAARAWRRWFRVLLGLLPILTLAACAGHSGGVSAYAPTQYYAPPGPPDDPWGPYIREAASRYDIPAQWIRAVMAQESGGEEQAVSPVGAIGLMQVMPGTYDELRDSEGLGDDPFNPHDNILAGAAYIKQMYDRYGAPGFLAAYNAGPGTVDNYLAGGGPLPDETVNYLAAVTPNLGSEVPLSGPFARYASASGGVAPSLAGFATGCDVNAAYDPDHPCAAAPPPPDVGASAMPATAGACDADMAYDPANPCTAASPAANGAETASGSCDTDTAFDPDNPCHPVETASAAPVPAPEAAPSASNDNSALYQPAVASPAPPVTAPATSNETPAPAPAIARAGTPPSGTWAIQVGAFATPGLAQAVAEGAKAEAPDLLGDAGIALPPMAPFGGLVLYRAQLVNLTPASAINACAALNHRQLPCIVLPNAGV